MLIPAIGTASEMDGDPINHYASADVFKTEIKDTCRSMNHSSMHIHIVAQRCVLHAGRRG
jgi:hypothetical protein